MQTLRRLLEEPWGESFDVEAAVWEDITPRARETLRTLLEAAMETELSQRLDDQLRCRWQRGWLGWSWGDYWRSRWSQAHVTVDGTMSAD